MDKLELMVLGEGNTKPRDPRIVIADNYNELVRGLNTLVDEINGLTYVAPYKIFSGFLSQTLLLAPTATVLENNIGTITFLRTGVGTYTANSSGLFTSGKTTPNENIELFVDSVTGNKFTAVWTSTSVITITSTDSSDTLADGLLDKRYFEIRVYS